VSRTNVFGSASNKSVRMRVLSFGLNDKSCDFHQVKSIPFGITVTFFADSGWSFLSVFALSFDTAIIVDT